MPQLEEEQKPHLSEFNDKWNKLALGISDRDVPSVPRDRRDESRRAGGDLERSRKRPAAARQAR